MATSTVETATAIPLALQPKPRKVKELNDKVIHRYGLMTDMLGMSVRDLEGNTPGEVREKVTKRLKDLKDEREESEILDQSCTITLAGKEVVVDLLPMSQEKKWKSELANFIKEAGDQFSGLDFQDGITIQDLMKILVPYLITDGEDKILELFFLYAKNLKKNDMLKKAENDASYREDLLDAALEVFKVFSLPFVVRRVKRLMTLQEMMN